MLGFTGLLQPNQAVSGANQMTSNRARRVPSHLASSVIALLGSIICWAACRHASGRHASNGRGSERSACSKTALLFSHQPYDLCGLAIPRDTEDSNQKQSRISCNG